MNRIIIATLAALAALACGGPDPEDAPTADGRCQGMGPVEHKYVDFPGYNPKGCTVYDRMANVAPFTEEDNDEYDMSPTAPVSGGPIGTLEQPITVNVGTGAAASINVNGSGVLTGFNGACKPESGWTTSQPLRDTCLIPNVVNTLDWALCPASICPTMGGTSYAYFRNRMKEAWEVWSRPITCGGTTYATHLKSSANSENTSSTAEDKFFVAKIPVYPAFNTDWPEFSARAEIDPDLIQARTPVRNGVRYYSWLYGGIAMNNGLIEGIKADACGVFTNDPQYALKIQRAYRYILAHEFGHLLGLTHINVGIMRRGSQVPCTTLYSAAATAPALTDAAPVQRLIVNNLQDSSGFSVFNPGVSLSGCLEATQVNGLGDVVVDQL